MKRRKLSISGRLFLFLALFITLMLVMVSITLIFFNLQGKNETALLKVIENEESHLVSSLEKDFSSLSIRSVMLSETLTRQIDTYLKTTNSTFEELRKNREKLAECLAVVFPMLKNYGSNTIASGVFLMLDATMSTEIIKWETSKAGIYLMKTLPNTIEPINSTIYCLIGPGNIARDNKTSLLGQWKMEYDMRSYDFLYTDLNEAKMHPDKSISRLYKWNAGVTISGNSDSSFIITIPIRNSEGVVYGLCGFEISSRLFKDLYTPQNDTYTSIFATLLPFEKDKLLSSYGFFAGREFLSSKKLLDNFELDTYKDFTILKGTVNYGGLIKDVKLYPSTSIYATNKWKGAILLEEEELRSYVLADSNNLKIALAIIIITSLALSFILTKRIVSPISTTIKKLNKGEQIDTLSPYDELNELSEYIAQLKNSSKEKTLIEPDEEFKANLKLLSPAEKRVFNLYLEGYNATQIAEKLFLSQNTIKTHSRRIFTKLKVSTRKELMMYLNIINKENLFTQKED